MKKLIPVLFALVLILVLLPSPEARGVDFSNCTVCGQPGDLRTDDTLHRWYCTNSDCRMFNDSYAGGRHSGGTATCTDKPICSVCNHPYGSAKGHSWEWVTDNEPTCGEAGTKHEECTVCHTKQNEGTAIDPTGNHSFEWITDKAPTCGEAGTKHEECSVCHTKQNEGTAIPATGHSWTWVTDKDPTCGEAGTKHEECSVCHTTRNEGTSIPATGAHNFTWVTDNEPTCGESGEKHEECSVCHTTRSEGTSIPATGAHNFTWVTDKEPTCGEAGEKHEKCTVCSATRSEGTVIDATGAHTLTKTARVEPTCTEAGTEEYWTCSVCQKMFSDAAGTAEISAPVTIPASSDGHKPGKPVKENEDIHCISDSSYDEVVYCTVCKKELSHKHITYKSDGHDYQPWEWHETITRVYYKCTKCGNFYWLHNSESWNMKKGLVRYGNGDAVDYKASATGPDDDGVLTVMPIKHTERDKTDDISLYMTPDDVYVWVWEKMNRIELVRDGVTLALDPREITPEMFGLKEKEKPDYYIFTLTPSGKDGWLVKAEALIGEKRIPAEELKGFTLTAAGKETEITANGVYKAE